MHPADAVYTGVTFDGRKRKDTRSPLKKVLDRTDPAEYRNVVGICPWGCGSAQQDRLGYCKHLLGFCEHQTLADGEVKKLPYGEPVVVEVLSEEPDDSDRRVVEGRDTLKVGDFVFRIASTLRVYRNGDLSADAKKSASK